MKLTRISMDLQVHRHVPMLNQATMPHLVILVKVPLHREANACVSVTNAAQIE